MPVILLVLLLAFLFAGLGFAAHLLWVIAVVVFFVWLIGWAFAGGGTSGRRQWYRRW